MVLPHTFSVNKVNSEFQNASLPCLAGAGLRGAKVKERIILSSIFSAQTVMIHL